MRVESPVPSEERERERGVGERVASTRSLALGYTHGERGRQAGRQPRAHDDERGREGRSVIVRGRERGEEREQGK